MKITMQATKHESGLWIVPVGEIRQITHWLRIPSGACPVSHNPVLACARLRYCPNGQALEVVALYQHVRSLCRGGDGQPRSVEGLALRLATDARAALGCPVRLDLWLMIYPWQVMRVSC